MGEWARVNRFQLQFFEAFDEPWRGYQGSYEACAGWWKRIKNDTSDETAFLEKVFEEETKRLNLTKIDQSTNKKISSAPAENVSKGTEGAWPPAMIITGVILVLGALVGVSSAMYRRIYVLKVTESHLLIANVLPLRTGRDC